MALHGIESILVTFLLKTNYYIMQNHFKHWIPAVLLSLLSVNLYAQTVYLTEAKKIPFKRIVFLDETGGTLRYTAFYQGASAPQGDLTVRFSVDPAKVAAYNARYGTEYRLLPQESWSLGMNSAVIAQGSVSAPPGEVKVTGKGYLKPSQEYLLPITVSVPGNAAEVDPVLSTVYYLITAVHAPGDVPRREVYADMVDDQFFSFHDKCLLALNSSGDVLRYGWNDTLKKFDAPTTTQTGWSGIVRMSQGGVNTIQALDHHGAVVTYQLDKDALVVPSSNSPGGVIFTGLGTNYMPVGNGKHGKLLMINHRDDGFLNHYGLNADWTAYRGPQTSTPFDFRIYKTLFFYGQEMIGITESGDMWLHPFSPSDFTFSTAAKKIGSGWEDYTHVTAFGTNLLARDANGKLWLYEFDIRGFWALKSP